MNAPDPPPPLLSVVGLDLAYRHGESWRRILHGVSFDILPGEVFGLVGESGSGKSTVAYQLLGYRHPNARIEGGAVQFRGRDLLHIERRELNDLRGDRIALVPQNPTTALSPAMRVSRQIAEVLRWHGAVLDSAAAQRRVQELLDEVGLPGSAARRYPHQLSGGQQQRVCIAMALACRPDLLVLDEPTTGLDVTTQDQIIRLLADLRSRLGMSMLYVTHDLGVLAEIADRVGVLYAGHLIETAPAATLFHRPGHPYTRGLIASRPQIDPARAVAGERLRGLLRRDQLPPGCPFAPRCDFAEPSCSVNSQRLERIEPRHWVACQRWRELPEPVAQPQQRSGVLRDDGSGPLLTLERVTLGYGGHRRHGLPPVVQDLTITVGRSEIVALVGESGSGKSTVARAISGLLAPLAGSIGFAGELLAGNLRRRNPRLRRLIQFIFQNPDASLNPRARVGEIVGRPLQLFFRPGRAELRRRTLQALDDVRLGPDYLARFPDQLSGGERQRVAIARALACEPELLLCDEVLSALDVSVQAEVLDLLGRLRRERGLAMLFITHDLAVVRALADRVGVLYRGQLMQLSSVAATFCAPFHPYTLSLLLAVPGARPPGAPALPPAAHAPGSYAGCAFAGRCPLQQGSLCETTPPPWREAGPDLAIRCHIPLPELAQLAAAPGAMIPTEAP